LIILTGSSFAGSSQTADKDTLCFTVPVVKERLTQARLYKYADSLLKISEQQLSQLQNTIKLLDAKEVEQKTMYEGQVANLNQQIALYKDQVNGYEKLLRRERFKRTSIKLLVLRMDRNTFYF